MVESRESPEDQSLETTPTWAVAAVICFLVTVGILLHTCLKKFGRWLNKNERKPLVSALEKVKDELMIFGLLSLLLGHWGVYMTKICVRSSDLSSQFYPCAPGRAASHRKPIFVHNHFVSLRIEEDSPNTSSSSKLHTPHKQRNHCPEGRKPLASYHSLEQLHRFLFVLGTTHVVYSFIAVALAVAMLYSWRTWENFAMSMSIQDSQDENNRVKHLSSFVSNHTSHPWSQHDVLVWLFCFFRQFCSFIDEADYMSLRQGFLLTHQLPLEYNFHNYMFRSMEEEFQFIVGISIPLWIFTILCVLLGFHGTDVYFWLSFCPAILAGEIAESNPQDGLYEFSTKDELFWFGNPRLILQLIHFLTFQNSFEMAMYLWSQWEIQGPSCFTENHTYAIIRLTFGLVTQFWCSFITFPLYVIVAQMGSKYKKFIISDEVRRSIQGWKNKAIVRGEHECKISSVSLESLLYGDDSISSINSNNNTISSFNPFHSPSVKDPSTILAIP